MQNEEGGVVSSLPVLFEKRVVDVLLNLKEIVNEPYEEMLAELHQELRETAKTHFSVLLEVGMECRGSVYCKVSFFFCSTFWPV